MDDFLKLKCDAYHKHELPNRKSTRLLGQQVTIHYLYVFQ
jgi:hypothetical protein